ncbi:acyl-CoA synthetase [Pseudofrankia sp. DC12]|uniref:acyl-CoA synthetase n=1 Tax=Pseudofrankia sp. DC12 TaxID=683315 RepID=UPI0005F86D1A|nr:acyl-CoA synthetase [Pseudofrankia sp. DC12]
MYPGQFAVTHPEKTAVVTGGPGWPAAPDAAVTRLRYAELNARSVRLARLLAQRGLRPGDTLAILAENHPHYFEAFWAAIRSGLYLTAVNWHLAPSEVAYQVADSGARALVATRRFGELAAQAAAQVPGCRVRLMMDGVIDGFEPYEEAVAAVSAEPLATEPVGEVMLYSSGTTGRPKGIQRPLADRQVTDPERSRISLFGELLLQWTEDLVYLCPAPLYHAAGLQWSGAVHEVGGTLVILEKFDPEQLLAVIEREQVTHVQVVPTMLVRLLKLPAEVRDRYDLSSLVSVLHAAAPCAPEVKRAMIDWLGPIIDEYYAATEGSGLTFIGSADWLAHPGSVGRALVGIPHICAEDGAELPAREPGLLFFEQERALFEYHGDPEKTKASRHPDHPNWATTGDVGYLDEDGLLYLTDRKSFMIISGGVNIYPAEVEAALIMHPKVADVAVFGLPDPEMGEYVHAVVAPAAGVEPGDELAEELRAYARVSVAHYKVPHAFAFRPDLPRMPTGKLNKLKLREEYLVVP